MAYPRPAKRANWPLRLIVVLLVLIGLAVAADRVALAVAERIAGDSIESSQHLNSRPDVSIDGFPFLTQLASAHYDHVEVTASDVPVGPSGRRLDIHTVAVQLHDVTTARNYASVHADSATADASVTFADLARTIGVPLLGYGGPGRVKTNLSVSIAGHPISGGVSAKVSTTGSGGLRFSELQVQAAGTSLPGGVSGRLGRAFTVPIPLSGLPFDIRITGVDVTPSGVVLHLAGRDLAYDKS